MNQNDKLWYERPAAEWTEALPIGNGRLGGMVFSGTEEDKISLNEDTLWSGYPKKKEIECRKDEYEQIVKLTLDHNLHEAQKLIEDRLTFGWTQSYMPAGDLILLWKNKEKITEYKRELDLQNATVKSVYRRKDAAVKTEYFATAVDNILVMRISADRPCLDVDVVLQSKLRHTLAVEDEYYILEGEAPGHVEPSYVEEAPEPIRYGSTPETKGMGFAIAVKALWKEGTCKYDEQAITLRGCVQITILLDIRTGFAGCLKHPAIEGIDYKTKAKAELQAALQKEYEKIAGEHICDYKKYYDRVSCRLGRGESNSLPTDIRLQKLAEGEEDLALYALIFQYGRYLLISSSRAGSQAANLQGIWNQDLRPVWSSNYTLNINTQMNYWPALPCSLREMQEPLNQMIIELSVSGKETARNLYGADGFVVHHNTDIWRSCTPVGNHKEGSAQFAFWNGASGWLCRHLFEEYEYTLDRDYLTKVYPVMKEAARFYISILKQDENKNWIVCPATSPENAFRYQGETCNVAMSAAMQQEIVRELFDNCIKAAAILQQDDIFTTLLKERLPLLAPLHLDARGRVMEWGEQYEEEDVNHRHLSHLYGLYPGSHISVEQTMSLAEACKKSLQERGDEGTGWSIGWKINLWARLQDGNRALQLIKRQLRPATKDTKVCFTGGGTYPNLFDAHPPFQIDGNFAVTAGIGELLLQSSSECIHILPALPECFLEGEIRGLSAKGGIVADIVWDQKEIVITLHAVIAGVRRLTVKGTPCEMIVLAAGESKVLVFEA